jgi:hypothetical protein
MAHYETNRKVIHLSKAKRCSDQAGHLSFPPRIVCALLAMGGPAAKGFHKILQEECESGFKPDRNDYCVSVV